MRKLILALALGCAPQVPARVSGWGAAPSTVDAHVDRADAAGQARVNLQRLMQPRALSFSYLQAGVSSSLTTVRRFTDIPYANARFVPGDGGWVAIAQAIRPSHLLIRMNALELWESTAIVRGKPAFQALPLAENEALRGLIAKALADCDPMTCHATGTLTLTAIEPTFADDSVQVRAVASVHVDELRELSPAQVQQVHRLAAEWNLRAGRLEAALAATAMGTAAGDASGGLSELRGRILLDAGDADAAVAAFEQALASRPTDLVLLRHLTTAEQRRGNVGKAAEWLEQALTIDPQCRPCRWELSQLAPD